MNAKIWLLATSGPERVVDGSLERMLSTATRQEDSAVLLLLRECSAEQHAAIVGRHPGVHVFGSAPVGLSRARNRLLGELRELAPSAADLVAFPDDDCTYPPDWSAQVRRAFTRSSADIVCGRYGPSTGEVDADRFPSAAAWMGLNDVLTHPSSITMVVRAEWVWRIGGFLGCLGAGTRVPSGEDLLYLLRAATLGARLWYTPDIVVHHAYKPENASRYVAGGVSCLVAGAVVHRRLGRVALRRIGSLGKSVLTGRMTARDAVEIGWTACSPHRLVRLVRYLRREAPAR